MEIKVCQIKKQSENEGFKTNLFEGYDVSHQLLYYKDRESFQKEYNSRVGGAPGFVLGVPDFFWKQDDKVKDIENGSVLLIYFTNQITKEVNFIIAYNCIVYITSNGQTIDKIDC